MQNTLIIIPDLISNRPRSIRFRKLIAHLKKSYNIHVLTFDNKNNDYLYNNNIECTVLQYNIISKKLYLKNNKQNSTAKYTVKNKIFKWLGSAKRILLFPDFLILEYFKIRKNLKVILKNIKYDTVISVSYPFTTMALGNIIKKYSIYTNWIIDIGDPFYIHINQYSKIKQKMIKWFEGRALSICDAIVVTTEETKEYYTKVYNDLKIEKKIHVIPQASDIIQINPNRENNKHEKTLVYAGIFYKGIREPTYLFEAINNIKNYDIKLKIFGPYDNYFLGNTYINKSKVIYMGNVEHDHIINIFLQSDILVFLDWDNSIQLPGKLFEYISVKKPILFVYFTKDSPARKLVENYKGVVFSKNDVKDIQDKIEFIIKEYNNFKFDFETDKHTWEQRALKFYKLIDNLSEENIK